MPHVLGLRLFHASGHAREGFAALRERHLATDKLAVKGKHVGIHVAVLGAAIQSVRVTNRQLLNLDHVECRKRSHVWTFLRRVPSSPEEACRNKDDDEDGPHRLEIELRADLEQSCVENAQGNEPRSVVVVLTRDRVRVERVVEIKVDGGLRPTKLENLRKSKIELIEA